MNDESIKQQIDAELARINANNPKQRVVVEYFGDLSRFCAMKEGWKAPLPYSVRRPHAETLAELRRLSVVKDA